MSKEVYTEQIFKTLHHNDKLYNTEVKDAKYVHTYNYKYNHPNELDKISYVGNSLSRKFKILHKPSVIVHTRYDASYEDASDRILFRATNDRLYDNSGFYITPNHIRRKPLSYDHGLGVIGVS